MPVSTLLVSPNIDLDSWDQPGDQKQGSFLSLKKNEDNTNLRLDISKVAFSNIIYYCDGYSCTGLVSLVT